MIDPSPGSRLPCFVKFLIQIERAKSFRKCAGSLQRLVLLSADSHGKMPSENSIVGAKKPSLNIQHRRPKSSDHHSESMQKVMSGMKKRYALLIGIDHYPTGVPGTEVNYFDLKGCVRDIDHVEKFLKSRLDLDRENITRLTSPAPIDEFIDLSSKSRPTYDNLVGAFAKITETADPGDHIYIHYSGHGGRVKTLVPDLKGRDGIDEALVPMDIYSAAGRYLRDIELALIFQRMAKKGILLSVVLDCCHSGGAVRGIGDIAIRGSGRIDWGSRAEDSLVASKAELLATWKNVTNDGARNVSLASGWLPEPEGYVLLAACKPTESAYEYAFNGTERNGALTYWLLDALTKFGPDISTKSLHSTIFAKIHSQFEQQTPQLLGKGENSLFGGEGSGAAPTASVLEVDMANRRVRLNSVGQAFGNRKGAKFAIYPLGSESFSDARLRQAVVSVAEAGAVDCWADIDLTLNDEPIEQGAAAILVDQGSLKLTRKVGMVFRGDLPAKIDQERALNEVALAIDGRAWVARKTETDEDTLEYQIALNDQREFEIWDPAGHPVPNICPPISIDKPTGASTIADRLEHLAKYNTVRQLENHDPQSPLARKLVVDLLGWHDDFTPGDKPKPRVFAEQGNTPTVHVGEWVFVRIRNDAARSLNVSVLDLQPDWAINQIYPSGLGDWFIQLEQGREIVLNLRADLPNSYTEGRDVLKVFGAVDPANFRRLTMPSLDLPDNHASSAKQFSETRGAASSLDKLMDAISGAQPPASGTRNFTTSAFPSADWVTNLIEINVRRQK